MTHDTMATLDEAMAALQPLGFERLEVIHGATFKPAHHVVIVPTRGAVHWKVISAWQNMIPPMNQKRAWFYAAGFEVGDAYNNVVDQVISHPDLSTWQYVFTLEDDNLPPPNAFQLLHETMVETGADAVSGLYFTKGDVNMPMAYGDIDTLARTGAMDFAPIDVREKVRDGHVVEVNGIGMGCALWKMELFQYFKKPWFNTLNDVYYGRPACYTQDLQFCERARRMGRRFFVDCRVKVGHLDVQTGIVY
jgi:hypothetical protein